MTHRRCIAAFGLVASLAACAVGGGNVLEVGPTQRLKLPSQAAAAAGAGDIIRIAPGDYTDCAVWRASRLTIEATGEGAVLADKTCAGKGIFVIDWQRHHGAQSHLRARRGAGPQRRRHSRRGPQPDHRAQQVHRQRERHPRQPHAGSTIRIVDSEFRGNAKCEAQCAHGIYVNAIDRLEIEHSRFIDQHIGHHIKSRARNTVLIDNDIADGPNGNSSYLVDIPNGGDLLMQGNRLQKGKMAENTGTAVPIGEEGVKNPTHDLIIRDNNFTSDLPEPTVFVRNRTTTPAMLSGNHLQGRVTALVGPGTVSP